MTKKRNEFAVRCYTKIHENQRCRHNQNLPNNENILNELETIDALVKNLFFQEEIPAEAIKQINIAHNGLKTIASHKRNDGQKQETI